MSHQPVPFLDAQTCSLLSEFFEDLVQHEGGGDIRESWSLENAVPRHERDRFCDAVAAFHASGCDVAVTVERSVRPELQMLRPVERSELPERLENYCTARRLLRDIFAKGAPPPGLSEADEGTFRRMVEQQPDRVAATLPPKFRETGRSTALVWWTDHGRTTGLGATDIRDHLALEGAAYRDGEYLLRVEIPCTDAGEIAVPTVIDAGWHPRFRPQPPGQTRGLSRPISGEAASALPEWVGRPPVTDTTRVKPMGTLGENRRSTE